MDNCLACMTGVNHNDKGFDLVNTGMWDFPDAFECYIQFNFCPICGRNLKTLKAEIEQETVTQLDT